MANNGTTIGGCDCTPKYGGGQWAPLSHYQSPWPVFQPSYTAIPTANCDHCGMTHTGGMCPRIKAVDYYEDGTIKRVEYKEDK